MLEKITKGGQGSIWKVIKKDSDEILVLKRIKIKKSLKYQKLVDREIYYRKILNHKHIVEMVDEIKGEDIHYIFYKSYPIDLLRFLKNSKNNRLNENVVKKWMRQLTEAMIHLNCHQIMHRDLKPDNILLTKDSEDAEIKLCDFGLIRRHYREEVKTDLPNTIIPIQYNDELEVVNRTLTHVGTLEYAALEVKKLKSYNMKCDVWSVGVITHVLLYGKYPHISKSIINFPEIDDNPSEIAKDFIVKCLTIDPQKRPYFWELINHGFLNLNENTKVDHNPAPDIQIAEDEPTYIHQPISEESKKENDLNKNGNYYQNKKRHSDCESEKSCKKHPKIETRDSSLKSKANETFIPTDEFFDEDLELGPVQTVKEF